MIGDVTSVPLPDYFFYKFYLHWKLECLPELWRNRKRKAFYRSVHQYLFTIYLRKYKEEQYILNYIPSSINIY